MISKDEILRSFPKEDIEEVLKVYQTMNLAYSKGITTFTNFFCKPNIWNYFIEKFDSKNFRVEAKGAFDECDRRILVFNNIYNIPMPYRILKLNNKSKFNTPIIIAFL